MFHNLSGHDAHLFIKELGKGFNKNDIRALIKLLDEVNSRTILFLKILNLIFISIFFCQIAFGFKVHVLTLEIFK